jgi:hypothetical protein
MVKAGKNSTGKQRYKCQNCKARQVIKKTIKKPAFVICDGNFGIIKTGGRSPCWPSVLRNKSCHILFNVLCHYWKISYQFEVLTAIFFEYTFQFSIFMLQPASAGCRH